jgi:hypothetical protein
MIYIRKEILIAAPCRGHNHPRAVETDIPCIMQSSCKIRTPYKKPDPVEPAGVRFRFMNMTKIPYTGFLGIRDVWNNTDTLRKK